MSVSKQAMYWIEGALEYMRNMKFQTLTIRIIKENDLKETLEIKGEKVNLDCNSLRRPRRNARTIRERNF